MLLIQEITLIDHYHLPYIAHVFLCHHDEMNQHIYIVVVVEDLLEYLLVVVVEDY